MSLLLDALKSDSGAAEAPEHASREPQPVEQDEEPLDAYATLQLLAPKAAPSAPAPGATSAMAMDTLVAAPPELMAEIPPQVPPTELSSGRSNRQAAEPAPAPPALAATADASAAAATSRGAPRTRRYGVLILTLAVCAALGTLAKSMWWPGTNIAYPEVGEVQPAPVSAGPPPTPSTTAVQVSSARPPNQFAYSGDAPEIDLHDAGRVMPGSAPRGRPGAAARAPTPATQRISAPKPTAAAMSITQSEGLSAIDAHVQAGYQALAAGNLVDAQGEYQAALKLDPNNIDALLGAAATAARDGRAAQADAAYTRVLELEPGNPDATAAKTMLAAPGPTEANESRLKVLIAGGGDRPALHAALAGVYAADQRWSDAAQEYFTALSKDPGNPDLAFDVAASLDQNHNSAMALNYYRQALAFAHQRATQIDLHALEQRIAQLKARIDAPAPSDSGAR